MGCRATIAAAVALAVLGLAACGGGGRTGAGGGGNGRTIKDCRSTIGFEATNSGPTATVGQQQLAFARLAVEADNQANGTSISLVVRDTKRAPALALAATQQFVANPAVTAIVGPADAQQVAAVGPLLGRAGTAFLSGSATATSLTDGSNPTFFRVVAKDSLQGRQDARFVSSRLHPKALGLVDDQEPYSLALADGMTPVFKAARIYVWRASISPAATDYSTLAAKLPAQATIVILPWQQPSRAMRFATTLRLQHKQVTILATDRVFSPTGFTFPGSYVSWFAPDITMLPADAAFVQEAERLVPGFGTFGPPVYVATHVIDAAVASVCRSGAVPTRSNVLAAIKATNEPTSILGEPIRFDAQGDLVNARWFMFEINARGQYGLVRAARPGA